jgi:NADH-quinone oxidoreductase subunit C
MPQQATPQLQSQLTRVQDAAAALAQAAYVHNGAVIVETRAADLHALLLRLRDDPRTRCEVLCHIAAVDYAPREPRFELVYQLYSLEQKEYLRVKFGLADTGSEERLPEAPSVTDIYLSANWHEREAFDLMGIVFTGHPDLRRIVLPERWDGHPLRKEYPYDGKRAWKVGTTVVDGSVNRPDDLGLSEAGRESERAARAVGFPGGGQP